MSVFGGHGTSEKSEATDSLTVAARTVTVVYKTKPFSGWVRFNLSAPDVDAVDTLVVLNVIKRCGVAEALGLIAVRIRPPNGLSRIFQGIIGIALWRYI